MNKTRTKKQERRTCPECGKRVGATATFCSHCGAPLEEVTSQEPGRQVRGRQTMKAGRVAYGRVDPESLPSGHIIDDRYEIKEKLGEGGFGVVYQAYDRNMETDKALKVLYQDVAQDEEAVADLLKEAQTMVKLNHPNIVRVYDPHLSGEIKYIDMAFVEGKTLTGVKLEHPEKRVPEALVRELALQIADAMAYAHSKGVIHKDVKPQNIMVTTEGQVKIMDFGIAEVVRVSKSRLEQTPSSGTLMYMSPEQIRGKDLGKETDIYSFGVVLYELLSGNPPFYHGDISLQILNEQPPELDGISRALGALIMKCLEKEYKNRPRQFEDIITALGGKVPTYVKEAVEKAAAVRPVLGQPYFHFGVIDDQEVIVTHPADLADLLEQYPSQGKMHLKKGTIADWVKEIDQAMYAELRTAVEDEYPRQGVAALRKAVYILDSRRPFRTTGGVECKELLEIGSAIEKESWHYKAALEDRNATLYLYLEARGQKELADRLRKIVVDHEKARTLNMIVLELQGKEKYQINGHSFEKPGDLLLAEDETKSQFVQLLTDPDSKLSIWLEQFKDLQTPIQRWRDLGRYNFVTISYALEPRSPFHLFMDLAYTPEDFHSHFSKYFAETAFQEAMTTVDGAFVEEAESWLSNYHDRHYFEIVRERLEKDAPQLTSKQCDMLISLILACQPDKEYHWREVAPIVEALGEADRLSEESMQTHLQFLSPHVDEVQASYDKRIAVLRGKLREMMVYDFRILKEEADRARDLIEKVKGIIAKTESQKMDGPYERAQDLLGMVTREEEHLEELSRLRTKARDLVESITQEIEQAKEDAIQKYEELRRVRKSLAQARWKGTGRGLKLGLGWGLLGGILFGLGGCCYSCGDSGFKTGSPGAETGFLIGAAIFGIIAFVYGYYQVTGEIDRFTAALVIVGMEKNKLERKIAELQSSLP